LLWTPHSEAARCKSNKVSGELLYVRGQPIFSFIIPRKNESYREGGADQEDDGAV